MRMTRSASKARHSALRRSLLLATLISIASNPAMVAAQTVAAASPTSAIANGTMANGVGSAFELAFWQSVTGSEDVTYYEAYLAKYSDGTFSGLARAKIAALQRALVVQSASAPATTPAPSPALGLATVPAVLAVPPATPALTPTVVSAATPALAPAPAAAAPQVAEMIAASATVASAEPISPLARLLAQLRSTAETEAVLTIPATPLVTSAPPVQPALVAAPGIASAHVATAPASPPEPSGATLTQAVSTSVSFASTRPLMVPVPDVAMPAFFCSSDARNTFHNSTYRPAVEAATRNNELAVTYLRQLQQTYDRGQVGSDNAALNVIAAEARAYQAEAARAYSVQAALVRQFDVLLAVPLRTCIASAR